MLADALALYRLLPAHIRVRDRKADQALEQFTAIVGQQAFLLQRDLERMYDGWFIETCDESLVPYIAELLGMEPVHVAARAPGGERARRLRQVLSSRSATANAIAHGRRKGTLWLLEEIARDVAHWPARAVEFYRHVVAGSHLDHLQPSRLATADVRSARGLTALGGPFDPFCHLGDVRRISHEASRGTFNVPSVGLFVWRMRPYPVTRTPAYCREDVGAHCYTFSALGHDTQLVRQPSPEADRSTIAGAGNLPVPIDRWALEKDAPADARRAQADPALYGKDASLFIEAAGWPRRSLAEPITADRVIPADLSDWRYRVPKDHVAVDPVLGRIAFAASQPPRGEVKVTYRYAFAMDVGGGEYERDEVPLPADVEYAHVWPEQSGPRDETTFDSIGEAFARWRTRRQEPLPEGAPARARVACLVIELMVSGVYPGRFDLDLAPHETVVVRAAPGTRPIIWLPDENVSGPDAIGVRGGRGSRVILDGLLIAGRAVRAGNREDEGEESGAGPGDLCEVWIRHCTLVPGSSLHPNCDPKRPAEPSLVIEPTSARVRVESSILGAIEIVNEGTRREPTPVAICDSVVDATSEARAAIAGTGGRVGHAELSVWRSTIVGRVATYVLRHAEDALFVSRIEVARRQVGCVRFCYVHPGSRTPRRYACQPDQALSALDLELEPQKAGLDPSGFAALRDRRRADTLSRVVPRFESVRYGTAAYLRLTSCTPREILAGAQDEAEMGVYHDLFEPQRLAMLSDRLADSVPSTSDAAVVFAS